MFCGARGYTTGSVMALDAFKVPYEYWAVNHTEKVKQIGNSVPCRTARAMMLADLKAEGLAA